MTEVTQQQQQQQAMVHGAAKIRHKLKQLSTSLYLYVYSSRFFHSDNVWFLSPDLMLQGQLG